MAIRFGQYSKTTTMLLHHNVKDQMNKLCQCFNLKQLASNTADFTFCVNKIIYFSKLTSSTLQKVGEGQLCVTLYSILFRKTLSNSDTLL